MPTVRELGEFGLIERVARLCPGHPSVIEGIGDDCAVVRTGNRVILLSCDLSIENVHFRRATATPEDIGWKAAASALSDIAAMGGQPLCCLVALACPADTDAAYIESVGQGIADAVSDCGAALVGGDTTQSMEGIVLDVTVVGEPVEGRYLLRKGARPDDVLGVTGRLGLASAGLHALTHGFDAPALARAHRHPVPRIAEGQWLCRRGDAHALIDISDGLVQDAGHLAGAAGLGIDIAPEALPIAPELAAYCAAHGLDPLEFILSGGEDYELAVALAPDDEPDARITVVGRFTDEWTGVRVAGKPVQRGGYTHFA
ncbi:MAG: Thiamine-monophosphate kinase [Candidatus Hydrogenedentes bacterium]|nr:Thiamine-monophosphate kinase [Candidatus Hydrogenedentota bacterium]